MIIQLFLLICILPMAVFAENHEKQRQNNTQEFADVYEDAGPFFVHQKNHVPGQPLNQTIRTIRLAINIWQKDDGSENFPQTDFVLERIDQMFIWLNRIFANAVRPVRPIEGVDYLRDSHIRFELMSVRFHRNSDLHRVDCGFGQRLNRFVFEHYPDQREFLNIHFNRGYCMGASGYANYPSGRDMEADSYIVTLIRDGFDSEDYNFWPLMLHLAHELGHNLDLRHPYNSEHCSFSHPDFLFDLFGFEQQSWCDNPRFNCDVCFHDGGWSCDLTDSLTSCTNNIMGGNKSSGSITPLQMGRMNRALSMRSVRKYAWGYSDEAFVVEYDQLWSFNKKFYQDIIINEGVTLVLTGTLEMVPEARIIISPGGRLIIQDGLITNALYSKDFWQGVFIRQKKVPWYLRWFRSPEKGELVIAGDGKVENGKQN